VDFFPYGWDPKAALLSAGIVNHLVHDVFWRDGFQNGMTNYIARENMNHSFLTQLYIFVSYKIKNLQIFLSKSLPFL